MESKLFGNDLLTLPKLMGSGCCFTQIIADVFTPRLLVNRHLNAALNCQSLYSFIQVLTPADDQLIRCIWLLLTLLILLEALIADLVFVKYIM